MQDYKSQIRAHEICRSKDVTRFHLSHHFVSGPLNKLVSTDGIRLLATTAGYSERFKDQTINADAFKTSGDWLPMPDVKYPEIRQLLPDLSRFNIEFVLRVPQWLSPKNSKHPIEVTLIPDGPDGAILALGYPAQENSISFNLGMIGFLAGETVRIKARDGLSPLLIFPDGEKLESYEKADWFLILMPMRAGKLSILDVAWRKSSEEQPSNVIAIGEQ